MVTTNSRCFRNISINYEVIRNLIATYIFMAVNTTFCHSEQEFGTIVYLLCYFCEAIESF